MPKREFEFENNQEATSGVEKRRKIAGDVVQTWAPNVPKRKLAHEEYTVGWICPLEVEQIAALEMLDQIHDRLPQPPTDHNVYNLGSIAGHNVVIAALHQPGNNPAATVVTQMRTTFPNLRFGLLVGIGGGVPVKSDNGMIRLGDVVVSKPAGGHSGAIQYDHGRAKAGRFERTSALAPPPAVLLNAAQDLAAKRARSRKDPVEANIKRIDTSIRGLRRYKHPGLAQDHLYNADYVHLQPGVPCNESGCDPLQRVQRPADEEDNEPYVVVHRGTIASGELVVKDAFLRDQLAKEYDLLCFETEAAGALADFPCIVIRGISDYCDSHKNDQWHGYAAAAAAAYARQLFVHMPIDEVKRYVSETAEENIHHVKLRQDEKIRQRILDWLTKINYGPQQSDYINRRQPGTGQWLIDSVEFKEWVETSKLTLFCPGIPGAGKTIITSTVVEELTTRFGNNKSVGVAYLYCNFKRQHEQKARDLLASLLKQLAQGRSCLPDSVRSLHNRHKDKTTLPSFDEIAETLQSVAAQYSRVFIIVDALDECQASDDCRRKLLSKLVNLQISQGTNIFATSRFIPEIVDHFKTSISLEIRANADDVARYVEGHIGQLPSFVQWDRRLQEEIKTGISESVDGMFLLAQIYLGLLDDKMTPNDIRSAMAVFLKQGRGLGEDKKAQVLANAYEQAMERINGQKPGLKKLAMEVLSWITCAKRQLTTSELQHALATKTKTSELDHGDLPHIRDMVSVCAGLVMVDEESGFIRLVHHTTQEYLERTQNHWFPKAESAITTTCVTYLSFGVFGAGMCKTDEEFEQRLRSNPLYYYAAHNWGHHALKDTTSSGVIISFLESTAKVEASSQVLMAAVGESGLPGYRQQSPKQTTGLHLAGYFGLSQAATLLLRRNHSPNLEDSYGRTPLSWASALGHEAFAKLLLGTAEVDVNAKDDYGWTPLWYAAANGHETIVKLLLARGEVDINSKDKDGQTLLSYTAAKGDEAVVKLLLTRDKVDINAKDNYGWTPLSYAAGNGHETVVKLLLARGQTDVSAEEKAGQTWLWWATQNEERFNDVSHGYEIALILEWQRVKKRLMAHHSSRVL